MPEFLLKTKLLRCSVDGNHLMCFQCETSGFQFSLAWCGRSLDLVGPVICPHSSGAGQGTQAHKTVGN